MNEVLQGRTNENQVETSRAEPDRAERIYIYIKKIFSGHFPLLLCATFIIILAVFSVYLEDYICVTSNQIVLDSTAEEMIEGNVYEQEIVCEYDGLESIELYLTTYSRINTCTLSVALIYEDEILQTWKISCVQLADFSYEKFMLDEKLMDSEGKTYLIRCYTDAQEGNGIAVNTNISGEYDGLSINGVAQSGQSMCYFLYYRNYRLLKKVLPVILVFILICGIIFAAWIYLHARQLPVEKMFLCLWIPLCILFNCANTPLNIPDEEAAFKRAYQVSQGDFISIYDESTLSAGGNLPLNGVNLGLLKESWQSFFRNAGSLELSEYTYQSFYTFAVYSPISFFPQALGIFIARHLSNKIALIIYAGRFVNWLFITILMYFAIKILPKGKEFLCLIALLPMNVQESASLSCDGAVVALAALMLAFVLYLRYDQDSPLNKKQMVLLYFMAIEISMYKLVYVVFCLLYFLIPKERFNREKKGKTLHATILVVLVMVLNLGWLNIAGSYMLNKGTDAERQLAYLLKYPLRYLRSFIRVAMSDGLEWAERMIGTDLGSGDAVETVGVITMLCAVGLIYIATRDRVTSQRLITKERIAEQVCLLAVVILSVGLVATSEYLYVSKVYYPLVAGIQGRYFLCLILPLYAMVVPTTSSSTAVREKENISDFSQFIVVLTDVCAGMSLLFFCI